MSRSSWCAAAGVTLSLLIPTLALAAMVPSQPTTMPSPQIGETQERLGEPPAGDSSPLTAVYLYDSGAPTTDPVGTPTWWSNYRFSATNYDHMARGFTVTPGSVATSFRIWWAYGSEGLIAGCANGGGVPADFSSIELDLYADAGGSVGAFLGTLPGTWAVLNAPTFYKEYTLTTPYVFTAGSYYASLRAQTVSATDYAATILWLNGAPTGPEPDFGEYDNGCATIGWTNLSTFYGSDQAHGLQVRGYTEPNGVDAVGPVGCGITTASPCVEIDFDITRFEATPMRGYSVDFTLSSELELCLPGVASITEGTYLNSAGSTTFLVIDNGGGSYTVDCAILGLPCGKTGNGTLFSADVTNSGGDGTGTVTVNSVTARDCFNVPIDIGPGNAASVDIDNTAPGVVTSLVATQLTTGNDADGTTKVDIAFTPPGDGDLAGVEVYRAPFGTVAANAYPEYNDAPGAGAPAVPSYPPGAPWVLTAVTTSGADDETVDRGYWYYVAFAKDDCANVSAVSTMTGGTLNYHLGDWHNGGTDCQGDNAVNLNDLSFLGSNYGISIAYLDPENCLDVGPTSTAGVNGRPLTDDLINFEDLIIFAINYGQVSLRGLGAEIVELGQPGAGAVDLRLAPVNREVQAGDRVEVPVVLTGKALDVRGIRTVVAYDPGLLSYEGSGASEAVASTEHFFKDLALAGQVDLNLATLRAGIKGSGAVMWLRFRALKSGSLDLNLQDSHVRDSSNKELLAQGEVARNLPEQAVQMESGVPAAYRLGDAVPNPFNPRTTISYDLPATTAVKLAIYDVTGRVVRTLVDGVQAAGSHSAEWDGTNDNGRHVESGVYFYAIRAGSYESQRRMALLK